MWFNFVTNTYLVTYHRLGTKPSILQLHWLILSQELYYLHFREEESEARAAKPVSDGGRT